MAEVAEVDDTVRRLWRSIFPNSTGADEENFYELGGASRDAIMLIAMLNEEMEAEFGIEVFFEAATVKEIIDAIKGQLGEDRRSRGTLGGERVE